MESIYCFQTFPAGTTLKNYRFYEIQIQHDNSITLIARLMVEWKADLFTPRAIPIEIKCVCVC